MKVTKKQLLKKETWVNRKTRTILTSDITWMENVGEVHHGFDMKAEMDEASFKEAMSWKNPGDYILEKYPADGTISLDALARITPDQALEVLQEGEWEPFSYEEHDFNYEVILWKGYGYYTNFPLVFWAADEEDALVKASLADPAADMIDADDESVAREDPPADQAIYLDRSEYDAPNVYLDIQNARVERFF